MKAKTMLILLSLVSLYAKGQGTSLFEHRLYDLYVDGKILEWDKIINEMKAAYVQEKHPDLLYSLCFAQYGYIGHCISKEMEEEAKRCLKEAIKNGKELEEIYKGRHDILALQGAFLGYQIILSKFSALYLAPKTFKLINTAAASSDTYFNCSLETGNMRFFTPGFLGGSKEDAISYYKNAVAIIEKSAEKDAHSWIYINTLLILANAYYETGAKDLACMQYERILSYEPKAGWIRKEMLEKCKEQ